MICNTKRCKLAATDLALLALTILFVIGIRYWFPVCTPMTETVMACHWAGETVKALSLLLLALAAVHAAIPDGNIKTGMDVSLAGVAALTAFVPGSVIRLCGHADMLCRRQTQPWTLVCSLVIALAALLDILFYAARRSAEAHSRKGSV